MEESWFRISVALPAAQADPLFGLLFGLGSSGQEVEDGADGRWVRVTAYFPGSANREQVLASLRTGLDRLAEEGPEGAGAVPVEVAEVPGEAWATAWQAHFQPIFPTPRIAVCPPWARVPDPAGGFSIVIEPGTAFGTGHHETTRMALQAMERALRPGNRVLDVGTGSGILCIAAVLLGAGAATGVDTDPLALENARGNAALNGVADRVVLREGSVSDLRGRFDLVVANIVRSALTPMLPALRERLAPDGRLILGGVLETEADAFARAVGAAGVKVEAVMREGEWVCLVGRNETSPQADV